MRDFYTMNEVCRKFGIARSTINRYMNDGKIRFLKTGTARSCKVLFEKKHIEQFMRHLARPMVNITQLAKETGVSRRTIYDKKAKLGRLPTKEELMRK